MNKSNPTAGQISVPVMRLQDVPSVCKVMEPLPAGDSRHIDMSDGRGSNSLKLIHTQLNDLATAENGSFVHIALAGHRGCGKSTELLALEHKLRHCYVSLHLEADGPLRDDYDYTYTFLWLVEGILRLFNETLHVKLDQGRVEHVVDWFSEVVSETDESVKKEIELSTEAESGVKLNWFGIRLGILAKLQSMIRGSSEERMIIKQTLQRHSSDLVGRVNDLLDHAHQVLANKDLPPKLLVVFDNLDRLPPHVAVPLFFDYGDLLRSLRVNVIYTVPVAIALDSRNIRTVFPYTYMLPTVMVKHVNNRAFPNGIKTLEEVVRARVAPELFASEDVVRFLAKSSGGSVRDLVRMVGDAALYARSECNDKIDMIAARSAFNSLRLDFESLLIPQHAYYPLLARTHITKCDPFSVGSTLDAESIEFERKLFYYLLHNAIIFEYSSKLKWFDVHPAILSIKEFKKQLKIFQDDGKSVEKT